MLSVPPGQQLAVSIDTLASGVHFLPDCDPEAIGHKCLAVGLSDLAAMGASPAWATLAMTLPNQAAESVAGLAARLRPRVRAPGLGPWGESGRRRYDQRTTLDHRPGAWVRRPRVEVRRAGARPGDLICVSGTLGDAGLALRELLAGRVPPPPLRARLEQPTPRVALGLALSGLANAMIDCSDGLAADLGHVLAASAVAAEIDLARLPLSDAVAAVVAADGDWGLPLAAGDDYELCVCLPPDGLDQLAGIGDRCGCRLTVIGRVLAGTGLVCLAPDGNPLTLGRTGYDHFGSGAD